MTVRRSTTDQEVTAVDVCYLKNADDALVLGGLNGQSIVRRIAAAAKAAGIEARITGH